MNATQFLDKVSIGIRMRARFALFRLRRRKELSALLRQAPTVQSLCPVCESRDVVAFTFTLPDEVVAKHFCRRCEHLFTQSMQTDLNHVRVVFEIDEENEGSETQLELLRELTSKSGKEAGNFLDFGVGGNIGAFQRAAAEMPAHRFFGCDVYPSDVSGYFNTYDYGPVAGSFDGISSYAVVEHLTDTLTAWRRFNALLKPVRAGGGIMVHSFPSQWNLPFDDWAMKIQGHSCLFSRKSLRLMCEKSGFEITRADPPRFVGPHYHGVIELRKVRDP